MVEYFSNALHTVDTIFGLFYALFTLDVALVVILILVSLTLGLHVHRCVKGRSV